MQAGEDGFAFVLTVTYGGQAVQVIRGAFQISPSSLICPYLAGRMGGGLHVSMSVYIVCSMSVYIVCSMSVYIVCSMSVWI